MDKITIIVPCYNEEDVLGLLVERLDDVADTVENCEFTYLLIDDGSRDGTLEKIRALRRENSRISYVSFSRNFGKEAAILAGLDYARGDAVVIMDADLQHPPELIPEMIRWWREGYDDVCTKREDRKYEGFFKRHVTDLFYKILQKMSRADVQPNVGDFRLLDRRCVEALRMMREHQRYTKGLFTWVGYKKKEIPFKVAPRAAGETTWNYPALVSLAIDGLTSYSTVPLRMTTVLGLLVSFLALIYMCIVLVGALLYGDPVAGYPTLMTVMLFLGGVQLLSLGIIGEYLGRVFNETKKRPLYLVSEYNGSRVSHEAPVVPEVTVRTERGPEPFGGRKSDD